MAQQQFADLDTVKAYLTLDSVDTYDSLLNTMIVQVQSFIERYTGRTFGWGDKGDDVETDYSNSDNIGIINTSIVGSLLTLNTMGPTPWSVGQNVSVFDMSGQPNWNGVWAVTSKVNPSQITVDISVSKGTLSPSDDATKTTLPAPNFSGYIGNYVQNYKYKSQDQYDGFAGKTLYLRNMDIRSVDTLYIGLRNVAQPSLLDHTQYVWRDDGRIILGGAYFNSLNSSVYSDANDNAFFGTVAAGFQTITISYWYGYIGVPGDIQLAACDIISLLYNLRLSRGLQREQAGDYSVQYDTQIYKILKENPDLLNVLEGYRRIKL